MTRLMIDDVRAVAFQECGVWVGQCLEQDVCASAPTLDELSVRLKMTLAADEAVAAHLGVPRHGPAPAEFYDMWERAA